MSQPRNSKNTSNLHSPRMNADHATTNLLFLIKKLYPSPPSLTSNERDMVVFVMIIMFILPVVSCTSTVRPASGNETDHLALLAIKSAMKYPSGAFSSWNHSVHHCYWDGVVCGRQHNRVVSLDLSSRGLGGTISPYIGNISFLRSIYLEDNMLGGPIPAQIGFLFRLSIINLNLNLLSGEIPPTISNCLTLRLLSLAGNSLVGRIPSEISSLSMLKRLFLHKNNLTGPLFSTIQNLTSLEYISAAENFFNGNIPDSIGQMKNLTYLAAGVNQLTGTLPASIFNLSSITVLSLPYNQLHGSVPTNIASALPNLQTIQLGSNHFSGPFPLSLSNISSLFRIELFDNNFRGKLSWNLGYHKFLTILDIGGNSLGSGDADDLSFLNSLVNCSYLDLLGLEVNNFGGVLPTAIANLSANLTALDVEYNMISGTIPAGIAHLSNLIHLGFGYNQLSGTVPSDIGKLQKLERISFSSNMITGSIPESLGNLSKLTNLFLDRNNFQGTIPSSLGNCQNLIYMDVSYNHLRGTIPKDLFGDPLQLIELSLGGNYLEGSLPFEVGQQKNLISLVVENNKLSGEIPSSLSSCSGLLELRMRGNMFHGHIPASLASLGSIQTLDLSINSFSGHIPAYLSKFPLTYLNLSYNHFVGEVPVRGVFTNASAISLVGNPELCGGIPELRLPKCTGKELSRSRTKISLELKLILSCACALIGLAILLSFYCIYCRKKEQPSLSVVSFREPFVKVSYKMLLKATEGLSSSNLLGAGAFGSVYKGVLEREQMPVAVKVLNLQYPGANKSFVAECEALRNIRHRNLVRVVTACSSVDHQGNDFKALVYEFMNGGSLENWLHRNEENHGGMLVEVRNLSLLLRVNIAIDIASALEYLHHDCEVPIVHRELKPSNILLDSDMVAHVGDFGLARFMPQSLHPNQSSSVGFKGTIGYAAPEYGFGADPSRAGDIYGYGIILLEMMTGKRPTDRTFKDGLDLHNYVNMALSNQAVNIVDPRLLENDDYALNNVRHPRRAETWMNGVMTMMKIGVACSMESPLDRMNLQDALAELAKVKDNLDQGRRSAGS